MEEKHAIEVTDLVISYQNLKKTSIKKNLLHFNRQKADRFVAVKGISFYDKGAPHGWAGPLLWHERTFPQCHHG